VGAASFKRNLRWEDGELMGYMRHHAIIVTGPLKSYGDEFKALETVWGEVLRVGERHTATTLISSIVPSIVNHSGSFLVAPDGSKEGWDTSDSGDAFRAEVIHYLETLRYGDGSTSFDYVEVQFGDDEGKTKIVSDSDAAERERQGE